jgi:hypothetical protein
MNDFNLDLDLDVSDVPVENPRQQFETIWMSPGIRKIKITDAAVEVSSKGSVGIFLLVENTEAPVKTGVNFTGITGEHIANFEYQKVQLQWVTATEPQKTFNYLKADLYHLCTKLGVLPAFEEGFKSIPRNVELNLTLTAIMKLVVKLAKGKVFYSTLNGTEEKYLKDGKEKKVVKCRFNRGYVKVNPSDAKATPTVFSCYSTEEVADCTRINNEGTEQHVLVLKNGDSASYDKKANINTWNFTYAKTLDSDQGKFLGTGLDLDAPTAPLDVNSAIDDLPF